jgi:hypothetical protein
MIIKIKPWEMLCQRQPDEPKFYGIAGGKGESAFLHYLKRTLNCTGGACICEFDGRGRLEDFPFNDLARRWKKARMARHGHLVSDTQHYIFADTPAGRFAIYNPNYAIEGIEKDWNAGQCTLAIVFSPKEARQ